MSDLPSFYQMPPYGYGVDTTVLATLLDGEPAVRHGRRTGSPQQHAIENLVAWRRFYAWRHWRCPFGYLCDLATYASYRMGDGSLDRAASERIRRCAGNVSDWIREGAPPDPPDRQDNSIEYWLADAAYEDYISRKVNHAAADTWVSHMAVRSLGNAESRIRDLARDNSGSPVQRPPGKAVAGWQWSLALPEWTRMAFHWRIVDLVCARPDRGDAVYAAIVAGQIDLARRIMEDAP